MIIDERVDVKENVLIEFSKEVLEMLLIDRTSKSNIIWATDNYKDYGKGYKPKDKITVDRITGIYGNIIKPRIEKTKKEQLYRTKDKAEVFTPSWLCNKMNNLLDEQRISKNSFNVEDNKKQTWKTNSKSIKFKKNYDFKKYIKENVIEITCGEAPYLVSRYDTVTGSILDIKDRIGLLDRKIRVINENVDTKNKDLWIKYVKEAYKHTYGYEWQGDSLLIARENLLYTFKDYYEYRFKKSPPNGLLKDIAEIISYNIWQMDGLKGVIPYSCKNKKAKKETTLFDFMGAEEYKDKNEVEELKCKGCTSNDFLAGLTKHNGTYCKIIDWDNDKLIRFISIFKKGKDSNMKFDYCIGNPPYQASDNNLRLFPFMYVAAQEISNCVEMIFPTTWREAKNTNGMSVMNNEKIKRDKQIVSIQDEHNAFTGVAGAEWTNIILWKKGYDNGLNGSQLVINEKGKESIQKLPIDKDDVKKPKIIIDILEKVNKLAEPKIINLVSASKPYGFRADPLDNPSKYHINLSKEKNKDSVRLFGKKEGEGRSSYYIKRKSLPKESPLLDKYKLFVVKAWGNMDEKNGYLGGSYSQLICASPLDCCSEMYIEIGPFKSEKETKNAYKYFNTKFLRAVFYNRKMSQNTAKDTYADIPLQDFSNSSDIDWSKSVKDIDKQLYKKYKLTKQEIDYIEDHIKEMN